MKRIRLGMVIAAGVLALASAGVASASIDIAGTGSGVEVRRSEGVYSLYGTWIDAATGTRGIYTGTLHNYGNYDQCWSFPNGCMDSTPPEYRHCNFPGVDATLTFRSPGKFFTIRSYFVMQVGSFPAVCQDPDNPSVHHLYLTFPGYYPDVVSEGYGNVVNGQGRLTGTSTALGASGIFLDRFTFWVRLYTPADAT